MAAVALDVDSLPVERKDLYQPPISELVPALSGLKQNFAEVNVEIVDCPDLTQRPFSLASAGLCGKSYVFDIGGPPFLMPIVHRDKLYDIPKICKLADIDPAFAIGAGAAPWPHLGVNCEGIYNLSVKNNVVDQQSRIASIDPIGADKGEGTCKLEILPNNETRCAILANLYISEGKPGKVVKVSCRKRIGNDDFITSIRKCLHSTYGDKCVGLGGVFLLKNGKSKEHIMPDFSEKPLHSDDDVNDWLHFFEMRAPLVNVGALVSFDPGLDLRIQHFHTFSHHGEGGHYHIDTTPDEAWYEGYFNLAHSIVRVDRPTITHTFGRD